MRRWPRTLCLPSIPIWPMRCGPIFAAWKSCTIWRPASAVRRGRMTTNPTKLPTGVKRIGDFELIREIGRGGMGVVYEARQISLDRRVAVKLLPFAAVLDAKQIARFKHEAQAAAQLHHPNIVPVFAIGVERGVHYYAMQYIDGQPLDRAIEELKATRGGRRKSCKASGVNGGFGT